MTLWLLFLKKDVIYLPDNYDINILAKMSIVCRKDDCEFSVNITNDDDTDPRHPGLGQAGPPRDCRNVEIHQPTNQPITTDSPGAVPNPTTISRRAQSCQCCCTTTLLCTPLHFESRLESMISPNDFSIQLPAALRVVRRR